MWCQLVQGIDNLEFSELFTFYETQQGEELFTNIPNWCNRKVKKDSHSESFSVMLAKGCNFIAILD